MKKLLLLSILLCSATTHAFDSGSDGSDGVLHLEADLGNVVFDPDDDRYAGPLDADRDGIYHFTDITIGSGTYLQLRGDVLGQKPLIWLASGDVNIEGILHLNGDELVSGVGGFGGGRRDGLTDGQGPGGGEGSTGDAGGSSPVFDHINSYLIPLIGGSGSGAGTSNDGRSGGGAMLLASSGEIVLNGVILGYGAAPLDSGAGDFSGNLRLVASKITGNGGIDSMYRIRLEALVHDIGGLSLAADQIITTRPGKLFPENPIKITLVDGEPVDQTKPGANKGEPDVTIDNGNMVTVKVDCTGIPLDATIRVVGWNDTVGKVEAMTGPLTGTIEASEATCQMVIPTGNTTFMAQAVLP